MQSFAACVVTEGNVGSTLPPPEVYALFTKDTGGWWFFKGMAIEKEQALKLLERHKHGLCVAQVVVLELPTGHVAYEWSNT
jgi:hypothetical protein